MNETLLNQIPGVANPTYEDMNIVAESQRLWLQLAFWMRAYFRSALEKSADLPVVTAQLFTLPQKFHDIFRTYFSEEIASQIYGIVYELINTNYQLVNAYLNNDAAAVDAATRRWYTEAAQGADYLAGINKFWDSNTISDLLFKYGNLKIQEIVAYYNKDYEDEIKIYNALKNKANKAAQTCNYMARGIIARNAALRPRER